jgi:phosphohistidine phosphatase
MKLYFLRHADAVEGAADSQRPLSTFGQSEARQLGAFLKQAGVRFDAGYASPLLRARQTAEIILDGCNGGASVQLELADALLNEASQEAFDDWLGSLPGCDHVLLVGHAPSLAERVCKLLGVVDPEALKLPKAGLACLETHDRLRARLDLFICPDLLGG